PWPASFPYTTRFRSPRLLGGRGRRPPGAARRARRARRPARARGRALRDRRLGHRERGPQAPRRQRALCRGRRRLRRWPRHLDRAQALSVPHERMNALFTQTPPRLGNQYRDDAFLRAYLRRVLPPEVLREIEPQLEELGRLAGGELYALGLEDRPNEPRLTQWDAWGNRVDRIALTPMWQRVAPLAAEHGLIAI